MNGFAVDLQSNGQVLAWSETSLNSLVVAEFSGARRYVAELPTDTDYRRVQLNDRFAFVIFERGIGLDGTSLCAVDLATGNAEVIVPPRPLVSICSVAANSTHVFWTQSSAPDVSCDQLWMKPLDGRAPQVLACGIERPALPAQVVASDDVVYWIATAVYGLDARSL